MRPVDQLRAIRGSWWLNESPEGLVHDPRGRTLGVLIVRPSPELRTLLLPVPCDLPAAWRSGALDTAPRLDAVALHRTGEETWECDDLRGVDAVLPIVEPLPSPWALLLFAAAHRAESYRRLRALYNLLRHEGPVN